MFMKKDAKSAANSKVPITLNVPIFWDMQIFMQMFVTKCHKVKQVIA